MKNSSYFLKGKNGQVSVYPDGSVSVGRNGWFGFLYQLLTRGKQTFYLRDITDVSIKRPGAMRGYLRISSGDGGAVVWLTNKEMLDQALEIYEYLRECIDARSLKAQPLEGSD